MVWQKSTSAASWSSQDCISRTTIWNKRWAKRVGMQLKHYFDDHRLGRSVLQLYCVSCFTCLIPQLQLWHPRWLEPVESVDYCALQEPCALQFLSHKDAAAIETTFASEWRRPCKRRFHVQRYQLDFYRGADKSLARLGRKQAAPVKSVMGRGMDWFG